MYASLGSIYFTCLVTRFHSMTDSSWNCVVCMSHEVFYIEYVTLIVCNHMVKYIIEIVSMIYLKGVLGWMHNIYDNACIFAKKLEHRNNFI